MWYNRGMKENNFNSTEYTRKDFDDGSILFTPKMTDTEIWLARLPSSYELTCARFNTTFNQPVSFDVVVIDEEERFVLLGFSTDKTHPLTYIEKLFTREEALQAIKDEGLTIIK